VEVITLLDYTVIGKRMREIRTKRGYTQALLAEKSGVEPSNISHIERAATKLSLPTLVNIANALEVSLDELLCENLKKSTHVFACVIDELLADCTPAELKAISEVIKTTKAVLRSKSI
jgi:transcriptional regulator with XRE-family HTH domain